MNPFAGAALVGGVTGLMLLCVGTLRRAGALSPELSRKCVHAGMGSVCAAFPLLFSEAWAVTALAGAAVAGLTALRFWRAGRKTGGPGAALYDVGRDSYGELWLPVAVCAVWWLSDGAWAHFSLPVLILAWADAVAALVGTRHGRVRYTTDEGRKSWEGSAAFFATAALLTAVFAVAGGESGAWRIAAIAVAVGLFTMGAEAVSRKGADNLLIPLCCWAQLVVYERLDTPDILLRAAVLAALVTGVRMRARLTPLNDGALFAAYLATYLFWALGGVSALTGAALGLGLYVVLHRVCRVADDDGHGTAGVLAVVAPPALIVGAQSHPAWGTASSVFAAALPGAFGAAVSVMVVAHLRASRGPFVACFAGAGAGLAVAAAVACTIATSPAALTSVAPVAAAIAAALIWRRAVTPLNSPWRVPCQIGATAPALALLLTPLYTR